MKKLLLLFLSLTLSLSAFAACGGDERGNSTSGNSSSSSSSEQTTYYKVTFKQSGQQNVVKQVKAGETLTDIPTPVGRTGYTVGWSVTDFTNITENLLVTAVESANEYVITYDAAGGEVTPATQTVTYDTVPGSFPVPTRTDYDFICWTYEDKAVQASNIWKIADHVTFVASWVEVAKHTVTFVQDGFAPVTREVTEGGSLQATDVPSVQPETGYDVVWEPKDLTNITGNITVNAVKTPKQYTVTYDANGGTVAETTKTVTYHTAYELATPTRTGYKFLGWVNAENSASVATSGAAWETASDVTVKAVWEGKTYTVTLNPNDKNITDGKLTSTTITVTYGEEYELPTPTTKEDYSFGSWKYNGKKVDKIGVWSIDAENIVLNASWYSNWTPAY